MLLVASCPLSAPKPSLSHSTARFRFALRWFAGAVALLAAVASAGAQTQWTVNSLTDTNFATLETGGGFGPGTGSGNSGDLRYVLFQAMATGGANTITFSGCTVANPCTIVLGIALPPIFEATANTGATAPANFSLTIDGGAEGAVILDGNSLGTNTSSGALTTNRVFFVDNVAVTLKNLVIQNATAQGGNGGPGGGGGAGFGAGLFVNQSAASAQLQNVEFLNCASLGGAGGIGMNGGGGGGLVFSGSDGGGGVAGPGSPNGPARSGGKGGQGGGGGGAGYTISGGSGGSGYADNAAGGSGGLDPGDGYGGNGGFGGGAGATMSFYTPGTTAAAVGGVQGGTANQPPSVADDLAGGGGAAAGPAIFAAYGSVTLRNVTGSGFMATPGAPGTAANGGGATAGTASSAPVFNYAGTVNGSTATGGLQGAIPVGGSSSTTVYGGTPVGQTSTVQTATVLITTAGTPSAINVLTQGAANLDFKLDTSNPGTCSTSTAYTASQLCTVNFTFTPQYPGLRMGAVTLTSGSTVLGTAYISGIGTGPQVAFSPGTQSTLIVTVGGQGLSSPFGVAVDEADDLYIADNNNNRVVKVPAGGGAQVTVGSGLQAPNDAAVDGAGDLFIADGGNGRNGNVYEVTPSGSQTTLGTGWAGPDGVAVDGVGNVFVTDINTNQLVEIPAGCAGSACQITLASLNEPASVTLDGAGDLFLPQENGPDQVTKIPFGCAASACQTTVGSGLSFPSSVAVDAAGNVFIADGGSVVEVPAGCSSAACQTSVGSGLSQLNGVAVDGAGDVFVTESATNQVVKVNRSQPPTLSFATTNVGVTSSAMTVTVQNSGNQPLSFSGFSVGANFKLDAGSTTCSTSTSLAPGGACNVGVDFAPTTDGVLTGTLTITDDTLNAASATQSVPLSGTGAAPTSAGNSSLVAAPSPAVAGSSVTVTATVKDGSGNPINGATVTFGGASGTASFSNGGVAMTNSSGVASVTLTDTAVETLTLTATVSGTGTGSLNAATEQFVAPAFTVVSNSDPSTGNGTAANCVDINLSSYSTAANQNCELRDAVAAANALSGVTATINFSGNQVVGTTATPAVIQIKQATPITLTANMNIDGPGANLLTISGGSQYQIFNVNGAASLSGLTLANGLGKGGLGGAIYFNGTSLALSSMAFANNTATAYGGALVTESGNITVTGCTFSNNSVTGTAGTGNPGAAEGGAINAGGSTASLTITDSTFSGNSSTGDSGAIRGFSGTLTLTNATVSNNTSAANGGGIYATAGAVTIHNSIVAGNSAVSYADYNGNTPAVTASLVGTGSSGTSAIAPMLSALGSYGGATQTMLPLPGSAAICAGVQVAGITADQRGVPTPNTSYTSSNCYDIGAVQTGYSLGFTTQPTSVVAGTAISPAPAVSVTESGNLLTAGSVTVSVTDAGSALATTPQTAATANGAANFSSLIFNAADASDTLTATIPLSPTLNLTTKSNSFTVTLPSYSLTLAASPSADGTVSQSGGGTYNLGTAVNITATPNPGYYFVNWTGSADVASTTSASTTITMKANESITANFAAIPGFVVTTAADDATGVPSNCPANNAPVSTNCTLRDAFAAAAALAAPNGTINITFSSAAFNAANTTAQNTITLGSGGTLNIPGNTTITGPTTGSGSTLKQLVTVSGANTYMIFSIPESEAGVTINGLAMVNGGSSDGFGGAISVNSPLAVTNSTFSGNSTGTGGAIHANSTLTVSNSTFSGNSAGYRGGAIYATSTLTVTNSTFSGNSAAAGPNDGGAIFATAGTTIVGCTFSGNIAKDSGGQGGAIYANSTLAVTDSTFSGNSADPNGGGQGSAIYSKSTLYLSNSIFAGNNSPSDAGIYANSAATADHNLFYGGDGFNCYGTCVNTNAVSGNPNLAPLGSYGGATQTFLPLPGSAAICAGVAESVNSTPITADQRGVPTPNTSYSATPCYDIGAVQTAYALSFTTSPNASQLKGVALAPSPVVSLTENGLTAAAATTSITMSDSAARLGGTTAVPLSAGAATFSNLTILSATTGDKLTATLPLTSTINLTANPTNTLNVTANQLAIAATHSSPIFQAGPGVLTLTVTNTGAATLGTATITDAINASFTINSVSPGCSFSSQTVTCTIAPGLAGSTAFNVYFTASTNAAANIANTANLNDSLDYIATGSSTDMIPVSAQTPLADGKLTQVSISGSTDNPPCSAAGTHTLTATVVLKNTSSVTLTNPYATNITMTQSGSPSANTLLSVSPSLTSVPPLSTTACSAVPTAPNSCVTFTFHIQLASCSPFRLSFDVDSD